MFGLNAWWFFLAVLFQGDILVLKNGKNLPCDQYTVADGRVTIVAKGQTFSIAETMVDWEASDRAKQALEKKEQAKKPEKKPKTAPIKRGKISLTTSDFKPRTRKKNSGTVAINFRMSSNSIIVAMHINGKGPFDFVLDTGASVTMIDPEILQQTGIKPQKESVGVVGVGGRPIQAPLCTLNELALDGAAVYDMEAVAHRISHLYQSGLYGLIGQDFLNHFVMNLDAANKTLTLTPTGTLPEEVTVAQSGRKYNQKETEAKLKSAFLAMEAHYHNIGKERPSTETNRIIRELRQVDRQIRDVKQQIRYQKSALKSMIAGQNTEKQKQGAGKYLVCFPKVDLFIDHLLIFNRTLTHANNQEKPNQDLMDDLHRQIRKAEDSWKVCEACFDSVPQ